MGDDGTKHPIAALLESRGIRHIWLAGQVGVHRTLLSHYLAGRRVPPESFYHRAAEVLGVPETFLHPREGVAA